MSWLSKLFNKLSSQDNFDDKFIERFLELGGNDHHASTTMALNLGKLIHTKLGLDTEKTACLLVSFQRSGVL